MSKFVKPKISSHIKEGKPCYKASYSDDNGDVYELYSNSATNAVRDWFSKFGRLLNVERQKG